MDASGISNLAFVVMRVLTFETLGTALLVFLGSGAAATGTGVVAAALAFGLSLFVVARHVSPSTGAHLNPAITLALTATGNTSIRLVPLYIASQFCGAILGAGLVKIVVPSALYAANIGGANLPSPGTEDYKAFVAEALVTAFFASVVLNATSRESLADSGHDSAPAAVATALAISHLVLIPVTGCSVNPARSFASAVFIDSDLVWRKQYLFFAGPFTGAAAAAVIHVVKTALAQHIGRECSATTVTDQIPPSLPM